MLSLTVRLYGNMFAGEQITNVFIGLTYLVVPVIFMGLHVFVAFLQAYVFSLLTMIYVSMATRTSTKILLYWHHRAECEPLIPQDSPEPPPRRNLIRKRRYTRMVNKKTLLLAALFLLVACPMFGQTPGASGIAPGEIKFLGGMIGLGIAGGLCGIGQGKAVAGARGSNCAESRRGRRNPVRTDSWSGVHRDPDHLRTGHRSEGLVYAASHVARAHEAGAAG